MSAYASPSASTTDQGEARRERAAPGLLEGDRTASAPDRQWQGRGYFPPAVVTAKINIDQSIRLCIAKQNSRALPSSAVASALRVASGSGPARPPPG